MDRAGVLIADIAGVPTADNISAEEEEGEKTIC
jgi:hypothetical protein